MIARLQVATARRHVRVGKVTRDSILVIILSSLKANGHFYFSKCLSVNASS